MEAKEHVVMYTDWVFRCDQGGSAIVYLRQLIERGTAYVAHGSSAGNWMFHSPSFNKCAICSGVLALNARD